EVVIAMPTAPGRVVRKVVRAAMDAHVPTRTVPALFEILSGRVSLSHLRKVEIQDLLRREPVRTDLALVRSIVSGQSVLVTGAGGSIGSELARQLAQLDPARLVLLGNGENEIFDVQNELQAAHPALPLCAVIADVRDLPAVRNGVQHFRPNEVFGLDMGEPIRIVDLATDLVRLSGLEVGRDIEIRYTGIRPGERLTEEPFFWHEEVLPTRHPKILRTTNNHLPANVGSSIEVLAAAGRECHSEDELRSLLKALVPDFGPGAPADEQRERPRAM